MSLHLPHLIPTERTPNSQKKTTSLRSMDLPAAGNGTSANLEVLLGRIVEGGAEGASKRTGSPRAKVPASAVPVPEDGDDDDVMMVKGSLWRPARMCSRPEKPDCKMSCTLKNPSWEKHGKGNVSVLSNVRHMSLRNSPSGSFTTPSNLCNDNSNRSRMGPTA